MPSIIKILPDNLINKIAAGEVVERPASVVKELVENAIDAGAAEIVVEIEQAGKRLIRVTDNGRGMAQDDAGTAFERHATSKISVDADLEAITTMGFRGEALSSIAAVSHVRMTTALPGASAGTLIEIEGGRLKNRTASAAAPGTSIEVSHLFFNTPARLKFLKSPATEFSHIVTALSRQAVSHSGIAFRLTHNKKSILDLPAAASVRDRLFQIHGEELVASLIDITGGRDSVGIVGLLSRPASTRADRTYQDFFVNRRYVKNPSLTHALYAAYEGMLMRDRHPLSFLFIDIDPALVDVNVHPAKAEVRFRNQSQIHDLVRDALRESLRTLSSTGPPFPAASPAQDEGVREAVTNYFSRQPDEAVGGSDFPPKPLHSTLFYGKRKTDSLSRPAQAEFPAFSAVDRLNLDVPLRGSPVREQTLVPLAQVHDSFILAESREGMVLIDQHAAHERVLFENLQDLHRAESIPVQDLLLPEQIEVGPAESALLTEAIPELGRLGLIVEHFGGSTFVIKAVPSLLVGGDYPMLLRDLLDEITVHGRAGRITELRDRVLSVMACHPAIKVNRRLDQREMEALLLDLFSCRMPHTCPHGRPTMVRFSREDIEKMFLRT